MREVILMIFAFVTAVSYNVVMYISNTKSVNGELETLSYLLTIFNAIKDILILMCIFFEIFGISY